MSRSLTGLMRVHADQMLVGIQKSQDRAKSTTKEIRRAVGLLREASEEIAKLQRQLEGSRAYAALLERRIDLCAYPSRQQLQP